MAENKVNLLTENFSVEKVKGESGNVKISGFALPFDTTSRNGFSYRKESIQKTCESLVGKSIFFNHNLEALPLGRVEKAYCDEKGMHYEANLMPVTPEERAIVEKVNLGLLDKVSIQCMYENANMDEKNESFNVDVKEFLELSIVGVPGFEDTSLQAHEKLMKEEEIKMAHKKVKEELEEKPEEETSTEEQEEPSEDSKIEELMNRISVLETRLDEMQDEESNEESTDEEETSEESEPEEEEDKKEESYTRKTAQSSQKKEGITRAELRYKKMLNY